ncbi:patatin-like phospholipase family protein [Paraburkholderia sabiae]|uniref:patatin-like phospholipase family protein n=1 Tax=Paraburkholderia sabiae TaxID=273251 RepID=UPI00191A990E
MRQQGARRRPARRHGLTTRLTTRLATRLRCATQLPVWLLLTLCAHANANGAAACTAEPGRPSVGLVLSGGGARGYAHLGVLKVLEENRIPVDCIAATSMGSVVGGLYASGMTATDIEHHLAGINLADIAFDVTERADLSQKQREDERLYVNSLTLGFGSNGLRLPAGLVQGNRLQSLLQDWTSDVPGDLSFDRLPIPYRAIATDLQTGQKVVLDRGSLSQAIRASIALPGLFAPTEVDGRTLIDGGIVSNLPVETARGMGAKTIIAVDIGSPLRPLDAMASPADVMQQMIGILIHQNVARQRKELTRGDVLIEPALGTLTFTDFAHANQAIAAGEAAARAALPRLQRLALQPAQYAAWRAAHGSPGSRQIHITRIEIRGHGAVPKQRILDALPVRAGDVYDSTALNRDLLALTTSGDFDTVTQKLVSDGADNTLVIDAREKSWGPNFLLFGLGLSTGSTDDGSFRLHLGYRRPWLTASGLEGRIDTTLGSDRLSLHAELRQPLSGAFGYYVAPYVEFERRYVNIYQDDPWVKLTQYRQQTERAGLDFGLPLSNLGDFRIGLAYAHGYSSPQYNTLQENDDGTTSLLFPDIYGRQLTARARLVIDQLDDSLFPRRGYFAELRVERSLFTQTNSFTEAYGKGLVAASYGRHSITAGIEAGNDFGSVNPINPFGFTLGGFQHLSAYATDQLAGNSMLYGQVTYMNRLAVFDASPIRGLFAGMSLEAGNVWQGNIQNGGGPLKRSITFFMSATTSFGPVYVGAAFAPGGRNNFYIQLGHTY